MAYTMRCKDAGMDCPGAFTTETAQELIKHVDLHLAEAHVGLVVPPEQVRQLIKTA